MSITNLAWTNPSSPAERWRGILFAAAMRIATEDDAPEGPPSPLAVSRISALRGRDPQAWNELFASEHQAIYRYALSRLANPVDAEDATSHVFAEAWEHAESMEDRGLPPRAWLFGIARNIVNTRRRLFARRPPALSLEAFDGAADEAGIAPELLDLALAIASLERGQAEVIALRFIHDLSLQETAAALGTTTDAVKGRQARALGQLRRRLESPGAG